MILLIYFWSYTGEIYAYMFIFVFRFLPRNLMKSAKNCADGKINHILFKNYILVFQFENSKGRQNGENHVSHWHVYANLHEPHFFLI